jgi:UDP-N-acetylglucosamine diphosphorylase/glucosamine-1-phosphate N-acetyltransferase
MDYVLADSNYHRSFLPLTFTRAAADLFMGMQTFRQRWERALGSACGVSTQDYLQPLYGPVEVKDPVVLDPLCIPSPELLDKIGGLQPGQILRSGDSWIAYRAAVTEDEEELAGMEVVLLERPPLHIKHRWELFSMNEAVLQYDFEEITRGRKSAELGPGNQLVGEGDIFLEEGAEVNASILNASRGPIYVGRDAQIMEGCIVRGGLALMDGAILKMGAKIYGPCSFGKKCKIGGEVNNSVVFDYSNKGHEGFLGNSILGSWCNLGADTNTSNMKNNYAQVRIWDYDSGSFAPTGLQFCGLIMGDHSKSGIDTMFNTGTVVGVSANIFGSGFPRNFVPSFSWGGAGGYQEYRPIKAFETARAMMSRRNIEFSDQEREILEHVFVKTGEYRNYTR